MQLFRRRDVVRFEDCDPAGIGFYPQLVLRVNRTVEDWFAEALHLSFADLHVAARRAIPAASLQITFHSPAHLGDTVESTLAVKRLGNSSVTLDIVLASERAKIASATLTLVHIDATTLRPVPWPEDLRQSMGLFLQDEPTA